MVATNPKRPAKSDPSRFAGKITVDTPYSPLRRWTTSALPTRPLVTPKDVPATRLVEESTENRGIKPSEMPKAKSKDRARVKK